MKKTTKPPRRSKAELRRVEFQRLTEQIFRDRYRVLQQTIDFSLLSGAPPWAFELIQPDVMVLMEKHDSNWLPFEIKQLQEAIDTLPLRLLAAAMTPAHEI